MFNKLKKINKEEIEKINSHEAENDFHTTTSFKVSLF